MTRSLMLIVIFFCGLSVAHSQAVETDGSEAEQQEQKPQEKKSEAPKPKPPKEVFRPSEEISEDSPVPFPVDI